MKKNIKKNGKKKNILTFLQSIITRFWKKASSIITLSLFIACIVLFLTSFQIINSMNQTQNQTQYVKQTQNQIVENHNINIVNMNKDYENIEWQTDFFPSQDIDEYETLLNSLSYWQIDSAKIQYIMFYNYALFTGLTLDIGVVMTYPLERKTPTMITNSVYVVTTNTSQQFQTNYMEFKTLWGNNNNGHASYLSNS